VYVAIIAFIRDALLLFPSQYKMWLCGISRNTIHPEWNILRTLLRKNKKSSLTSPVVSHDKSNVQISDATLERTKAVVSPLNVPKCSVAEPTLLYVHNINLPCIVGHKAVKTRAWSVCRVEQEGSGMHDGMVLAHLTTSCQLLTIFSEWPLTMVWLVLGVRNEIASRYGSCLSELWTKWNL
jgi:hypothetical protein